MAGTYLGLYTESALVVLQLHPAGVCRGTRTHRFGGLIRKVDVLGATLTLAAVCPQQRSFGLVLLLPGAPPGRLGREVLTALDAGLLRHELHDVVVDAVLLRHVHGAHEVAIDQGLDLHIDLGDDLGEPPEEAEDGEDDGGVDAQLGAQQAVDEEDDLQDRRGLAGAGEERVHDAGWEGVRVVGVGVIGQVLLEEGQANLPKRIHDRHHDGLHTRAKLLYAIGCGEKSSRRQRPSGKHSRPRTVTNIIAALCRVYISNQNGPFHRLTPKD